MLDRASLEAVRLALREDLGKAGDITSVAVVGSTAQGRGAVISRQRAILAGREVFETVFGEVESSCTCTWDAKDGDAIEPGAVVGRVEGPLRALLTAERTALNFLQRLSGVATETRRFVDEAANPSVEIRDTRKTTPGLRVLEKAAVRAGGGTNHRMGLFDAVLIKDNHIAVAGSVSAAIAAVRSARPGWRVQIECEKLEDVRQAVEAGADELLLDNMTVDQLRAAVAIVGGRARTEASGGVTLETVREIAATGVDAISVGALTHSAPAVDLSFEIAPTDKD